MDKQSFDKLQIEKAKLRQEVVQHMQDTAIQKAILQKLTNIDNTLQALHALLIDKCNTK